MFTSGQLLFAAIFVIVFIIAMIYVYRKDIALHRLHYQGSFKVLIGFIIFILMLFVIKIYLKKQISS